MSGHNVNDDSLESMYHKGVKHMYDNGIKHVPPEYTLPLPDRPNPIPDENGCPTIKLDLPVIDFAELLRGPNRARVLQSLAYACENYGFFQLVNHGIPEEVISNMVNVSRMFFEMPLPERENYMSSDMSSPVRYGTSFNQTNDDVFCWRDFLKLVCHPQHEVALPHWPTSPSDFRKSTVCYAKETRFLFMMLVEVILESLGTKGENVLRELENGSQIMVVNCYPSCPQPELTLGMPPHSDYGFLTLLLQDQVEGLQIEHWHNWVTVRLVHGSFVVNVGDHLEILSNGRYKSVLHRVVVNATSCRISVASLHSFTFMSIVRPSDILVTPSNPRIYKDTDFTTFLNYLKSSQSKENKFIQSRKFN